MLKKLVLRDYLCACYRKRMFFLISNYSSNIVRELQERIELFFTMVLKVNDCLSSFKQSVWKREI